MCRGRVLHPTAHFHMVRSCLHANPQTRLLRHKPARCTAPCMCPLLPQLQVAVLPTSAHFTHPREAPCSSRCRGMAPLGARGGHLCPLGPGLGVPGVRCQRPADPRLLEVTALAKADRPPAQPHAEGAAWPQGRTGRSARSGSPLYPLCTLMWLCCGKGLCPGLCSCSSVPGLGGPLPAWHPGSTLPFSGRTLNSTRLWLRAEKEPHLTRFVLGARRSLLGRDFH